MGLFPVGRLCAGWMAVFEETQAAIELKVKAGPDSLALRHSNYSTTMSVTAVAREEKEKGGEKVTEDGGIVAVFDFGRERGKKERKKVFLW